MKKNIPIFILLFASILSVKSQINTSTLTTAQYVQNVLLGGGVTVSNITFTGAAKSISSFSAAASTNLGLPKGVYLTCGSNGTIAGELGPNGPSSGFQSINQNQNGDFDLDGVSGFTTYDASVLEFDFIPQSDTVRFRYVFGSEEYNDYVNSTVNDAFAFLLNGVTTPLPQTNIALIPGTSTPISINTVNNGNWPGVSAGPCSNCGYYRDNISGGINCVYDGLTTVLTAKHHVICGEKYHIKIAIADAGDHIYDSGVFLEAGSFSSLPPLNVYTTNSNSNIPDSILVEDCNTYCAYFIRNGNLANVDSFNLQVTGNAILGTDYIQSGNASFAWPTKLIFAANQDTIKICNIVALQDNIAEGSDTLSFSMTSFVTQTVTSCFSTNVVKFNLYIQDYVPISIGQNNTSVCSGLSTVLNASATNGYAPYTYTWTAPSVTTPTMNTGPINSPQTFTITVNDICNKPVTKQITVTPVATPTVVATSTVICYGDTASLSVTGATTYTWSNGNNNDTLFVSPTTTTNYTVVGAVGSCTNSAIGTVTVNSQGIIITGNNSICIGDSTVLTATGGSSYTWDTGSAGSTVTVTPNSNTTYTVTSVSGTCTNTAVYSVTIIAIPTITITGVNVCVGQPATLQASGANSYTWSTGATTYTTVINPSGPTTYTVIGAAIPGCTNSAVFTATPVPSPTVIVTSATICPGGTANLTASGATSYSWSNSVSSPSISVSPSITTNYTVVGVSGNCGSSAVSTVSVINTPLSISGDNSICLGESTLLTANGSSNYLWDDGATTNTVILTPTINTEYTVSTVVQTCTNTAAYTVSVFPVPTITVSGTPVCPSQNAVLTATGASTYAWSTGQIGNSISVNPASSTTYTVIGTSVASCTASAVFTLNVITAKPDITDINPITFCLDSIKQIPVNVTNGNPPYVISWLIPGNGIIPFDTLNHTYYFTQSVTPSNTNYIIIATDQCQYSDTIILNLATINCSIIIPNVVTPNGDNVNEYFKINGLDGFPGSSIFIYNRWGNKIYSSDNYKNDWKPDVNAGTYFYIINISDGRNFNGFFQVFKD